MSNPTGQVRYGWVRSAASKYLGAATFGLPSFGPFSQPLKIPDLLGRPYKDFRPLSFRAFLFFSDWWQVMKQSFSRLPCCCHIFVVDVMLSSWRHCCGQISGGFQHHDVFELSTDKQRWQTCEQAPCFASSGTLTNNARDSQVLIFSNAPFDILVF